MVLEQLRISRNHYGPDKGEFVGSIEFKNKLGRVEMKLSPEQCQKLFLVVADGIVDTAKEAANELTVSVIEHKNLIEQGE